MNYSPIIQQVESFLDDALPTAEVRVAFAGAIEIALSQVMGDDADE